MATNTVAHAFVPSHQRPSVFARFAAWIRGVWAGLWAGIRMALAATAPEAESYEDGAGFPEPPEAAAMRERPASADPAHVQTEPPSGQTTAMQVPAEPAEPRPEPPLVYMPPSPQDVLRNVAHAAMDMIGRDVDNQGAYDRLQIHMAELLKRARQTEHLLARSQSNVAESAMDAALLTAADRRGESAEKLEQRAARVQADIVARARRASDPTPTGTLPRITEEMPAPSELEAEEPTVPIEPDHPWTADEGTTPEQSAAFAEIDRQHQEAGRVDAEYFAELERRGREYDADTRKTVSA